MQTFLGLRVDVAHNATPLGWSEQAGIEFWNVELVLAGTLRGSKETREAVVATAALCRVDNNLCLDQVFELDCISYDLGVIGEAIESSEEALSDWSIAEGMNSTYLIADLVIVDKFWRGRRIGPAVVFFIADLLRVDAIFLKPVALVTHVDADGRADTDYSLRRPGPEAQKKVRGAWRRAGFVKLADGVVWTVPPEDRGAAARAVLDKLGDEANTAGARAWWRRRVTRADRSQRQV